MLKLDDSYIKLTQAYSAAAKEKKKDVYKDIPESTARPLRSAGKVWQSKYDAVRSYLNQSKENCNCPELKDMSLLINVKLGNYLSTMYKSGNYMRNFTFGNKSLIQYQNDLGDQRAQLNSMIQSLKNKYNQAKSKCP